MKAIYRISKITVIFLWTMIAIELLSVLRRIFIYNHIDIFMGDKLLQISVEYYIYVFTHMLYIVFSIIFSAWVLLSAHSLNRYNIRLGKSGKILVMAALVIYIASMYLFKFNAHIDSGVLLLSRIHRDLPVLYHILGLDFRMLLLVMAFGYPLLYQMFGKTNALLAETRKTHTGHAGRSILNWWLFVLIICFVLSILSRIRGYEDYESFWEAMILRTCLIAGFYLTIRIIGKFLILVKKMSQTPNTGHL